jgi:hypothetical protein
MHPDSMLVISFMFDMLKLVGVLFVVSATTVGLYMRFIGD